MAEQHRATNLQWACIKARTCGEADVVAYSTIHELLCRIEALEAAAKPNHSEIPDSLLLSQVSEVANRIRAAAHMRPNYPAKPDSSLMGRVGAEIDNGIACDREPERVARDVIHAVAAWLREQKSYAHGWAIRLELEAEQ